METTKQIPTAEELAWNQEEDFKKILAEKKYQAVYKLMIEFAKLHVEAALESATHVLDANADADYIENPTNQRIIDSYPLSNIK